MDQQLSSLPVPSVLRAMLIAFTGFSFWVFADAMVRGLREYPSTSIAFVSYAFALLLCLVLSPQLGGLRETFTRPRLAMRVVRGGVIAICGFLSFITFSNLPLATAYSIVFLIPLVSKILSVFLKEEKISPASWLISLLGFAGVLVVVRPGMAPMEIGTISALASVVFFSLGYVLGRKIGQEHQTLLSLVLFQYLFVCLALGPFVMGDVLELPLFALLPACGIGALSVAGTLCVSYAYANAPTANVAPVHYVQILWGVILGAVLFGEYPTLYTLVGGGLVVLSGLLLLYKSRRA